jgi:dihydrodipicolinate synthase/N-acetylneuraminate lyase
MGPIANKCPQELRAALTGPCPSIKTPFKINGEIDWNGLHCQLDFVIEAGAKNIILTYGDSLYSLFTDDEIAEFTKVVVEYVDKRVMVVAATGIWWTGKTAEFAKYCAELGADMLMVLPPDWGASTTVETLVTHYRAASEHIPVMVVTNYLGQRPVAFAFEVIETLVARVPGIVALKDDVGNAFVRKVCTLAYDHWAIIAGGSKENHMSMLPYGVDGNFSLFIMFKPELAWRYWNAIFEGKIKEAAAFIRDYDMPLFEFINTVEGGRDAAIHGILEIAGHSKRYRRAPYHSISDKQFESLQAFISERYGS